MSLGLNCCCGNGINPLRISSFKQTHKITHGKHLVAMASMKRSSTEDNCCRDLATLLKIDKSESFAFMTLVNAMAVANLVAVDVAKAFKVSFRWKFFKNLKWIYPSYSYLPKARIFWPKHSVIECVLCGCTFMYKELLSLSPNYENVNSVYTLSDGGLGDFFGGFLFSAGQQANEAARDQLSALSFTSLAVIFGAGLVTSLSPCTFKCFAVDSRLHRSIWLQGKQSRALLGIGASFAGKAYGQIGQGLPLAASGLAVVMGLNLLETIELRLPSFFDNFDARSTAANFPSSVQAYLAGLTFALAASLCSTPVLATLLGCVATSKDPVIYITDLHNRLRCSSSCCRCRAFFGFENSPRGSPQQVVLFY